MIELSSETPQHITYLLQIPAIITCISSGFVVLTFFLFKDLRRLRYIELVFYISVSDFISGLTIAIGKTENGSFACYFQGIGSTTALLSSIFWTVVVNYQVYLIVNRGGILKDLTYFHYICWGLPTLLTLIPLSTSTYGNDDDSASWCFLVNRTFAPSWVFLFWVIMSLYFWVFFNLIVNIVLLTMIILRLKNMQVISETIKTTVRKLILYPIAIFLCWILGSISLVFRFSGLYSNGSIIGAANCAIILQGFVFSTIFFSSNQIVRLKWKKFGLKTLDDIYNFFSKKDENTRLFSVNVPDLHFEDELDFIPFETDDERRSTIGSFLRFTSTAERESASLFNWNSAIPTIRSLSNTQTITKQSAGINNAEKDLEVTMINNPLH